MPNNLFSGLNPRQHDAVTAPDGPVLVLAGPGSGKTRVLTHRIAYLIQERGVRSRNIVAVTFTNKAAAEMRHRVDRMFEARVRFEIGTFHAICARILRIEHESTVYNQNYIIYDTDDQLSAVKQALGDINIDSKKWTPRRILSAISNAKNELILPQNYVGQDYFGEIVARVYPRYQQILVESNAMDFDDLLLQTVLLMKNNEVVRQRYQQRYEHILVDEFQDTNMVQYQLVEYFAKPQNNVFVVGDEDQSIYAFRGADYRNVLRFNETYPDAKVVVLEQNYRSPQPILDVAKAVIDHNINRTPKHLFTDRTDGDPIIVHEAYDDSYEANFVVDTIEGLRRNEGYDYSDFAIMYRTNAQSRAMEDACIRNGIPYTLVGGVGFYKRREVRDMLAYLRTVHNPDDRISFDRIVNTPKRGIGDKSLKDFYAWAEQVSTAGALAQLRNGDDNPLGNRVSRLFTDFAELLGKWQELVKTGKLVHLFDTIVADIGYTMYLNDISDNPEQFNERNENLRELRGLVIKADEDEIPLSEFLTELALVSDVDNITDDVDKVTLLTLHAAKGLEYPVVFVTGLEDGLLPHARSFEDPEGLQEERRLFYVGITRAMQKLYITYAFRRALYGGYSDLQDKSGFLFDIPEDLIAMSGAGGNTIWERQEQSYRRQTTWDSGASNPRRSTPSTPSGLDRLRQDLREQTQKTGHVSDEKVRGKIIPFPGSNAGEPLRYKTGMRVEHPAFGIGRVLTSKRQDGTELVDVAFENRKFGIKTLDTEFASMKILD